MRGRFNRALVAVAGVVVFWTATAASLAADSSGITAPGSRYANSIEIPVVLPESSSGPQDLLRNPLEEVSGTLSLGNGFALESGLNVDVGRVLDRYVASEDYAFDGLFYSTSALGSPYLTISSGGTYFGLRTKLADGLSFSFGQTATKPGLNRYLLSPYLALRGLAGYLPFDARNSDSVVAGMTWNFAKWGGVSFTASRGTERGGVLGLSHPSIGSARTSALGVTAHVGFGGGWVTTASYSEGATQLELRPGAFAPDASLRTESYGVAVAKHGLFSKNDALGVAFARPAPNFSSTFAAADNPNELQFFGRDRLSRMAAETDIELGYKTEFFGDSIALQANASYQMNYGGIVGKESVSLLSRAKIKF